MNTVSLLHWILFLPLGAAAFSAFFLRRQGAFAAWFSTLTAFVIASLALTILTQTSEDIKWHYELGKIGGISLGFGYLIDANARLMLFVVSFVAAWIHLFSVGYMKEDDSRGRFFAGLSIFMFSILGIVIADNLLMTFIFWELVGFSSYMLIAHYFDTDFAAEASKKAFITNRIGDLGFILGIALCLKLYGTLDFAELKLQAGSAVPIALGLLLMCGFLGKSAQFPLHVWLTDAMAGPTPVSALIHAATMVAAGVYFMARVSFLLAPEVLHWMAISGAGMAALAGLCALAQTDIKKSLAYSTLAHLGIMGCAIGLGHPELAVLHMAMHAFFKATLFLGAGSVIHGCHHEQDMLKMGGLLKKMPMTAATFIAATLSNCAVPFFAGWYSKDAIIEAAWHGEHFFVFSLLALAAIATCLYSGRMIRLVFMGAPNSKAATHAHESPWTMTLPISVLGIVYAIGAGFAANILIPHSSLQVVEKSLNEMAFHLTAPATIVGIVALILGFLSFKFYGLFVGQDSLQKISPRTYQVLEYRWMDTFYNAYIDKVQRRFAEFIVFLDLLLINGLAVRWIIGGTFAALGHVSSAIFHRGQTRAYAIWITLGSLLFIWFLLR